MAANKENAAKLLDDFLLQLSGQVDDTSGLMTTKQMARETGMNEQAIRRRLQIAAENGRLESGKVLGEPGLLDGVRRQVNGYRIV